MTTQYLAVRGGNLALRPEKADTTGFGVVLQPSFVPGLSASVDYYNINMKDAIGQPSPQTVVDRCFEGNQEFCDAITRGLSNGVNVIERIDIVPFNIAKVVHRGLDFELGYRMPLEDLDMGWAGDMDFRFLATHYIKHYENNGIDTPTQTAGAAEPSWLYRMTLTYSNDPLRLTLIGRGISSRKEDNSFIECTAGCPASTADHRTINNNHIAGRFYVDANMTYLFQNNADDGRDIEVFLNVKNIANTAPPVDASGPGGVAFSAAPTDLGLYDGIGRTFRAGVRFRM